MSDFNAFLEAMQREAARLRSALEKAVNPDALEYYVIEMPLTLDGRGPATFGRNAHEMSYEVWDRTHTSHHHCRELSEAVRVAAKLNAAALAQETGNE